MGIKSDQMDVETPNGGRDRVEDCIRERGGGFTRGNLAGLELGGFCPFHHDVGLGSPMTSPMTSFGILRVFGGSCVPSGTFGRLFRPKKAQRFAQGGQRCPNMT
jgi:hypothetical protein